MITNFLVTFSRFEFALKESLEFASGDEKTVTANWDKFVESIKDNFDPNKNRQIKQAVDFLINQPPMKQSRFEGNIFWKDRNFEPNDPLICKLNLHIRDIRNNLFHGGKFNMKQEPDVARNSELIDSALVILDEWLELSEEVRTYFLKEIT